MANSDIDISRDELDRLETQEWLESLDYVLKHGGPERVQRLLEQLETHAHKAGVEIPFSANTPYINTIPVTQQPPYPGDYEMERRIKSIIRWNAMAMVVRANKASDGIGGHISTYASSATLYEVGFNHFFRGKGAEGGGDQVYFQGHASPGMYSRAFVEGRLSERDLINFRQELRPERGLCSYPHPWLMPDFWEFPTVSMGLGPLTAIYQARYNRYLHDRGLKDTSQQHVWCFIGDGECDEPETLGAITLPAREKLDNLTFVINCNLQRLDGPVRGNGKIIQELEAAFRGAGWNVIKVIWGGDWDPLLAQNTTGELVERMGEVVDGQYQKYTVETGAYARNHFFNSPRLQELAAQLTDEQIRKMTRGGHDSRKVYAAYKAALEHKGAPTVILAKTVKGYGLGEAGEGKNITHQQKKMNEVELRAFRARFNIPISDEEVAKVPFYRFPDDSPEMKYLCERRQQLGGSLPKRTTCAPPLKTPPEALFEEFYAGSGEPKGDQQAPSTTGVYGRILNKLMRDKDIGRLIVPIIPDEARTFGMDSMFRPYGIYSHVGQLYEPVDAANVSYYKEAKNGQILEEGINEAGSMASFIAAGTAYATHGINTIPFYIYYSMFGQQRVGDLFWAAGDLRCRGFLVGGTAGRTTLAGEGLQHQDGHSHLLAYAIPNLVAYDPAYAYELAVIIRDGIRRMYEDQESIFYYLTVMNENYIQPPMPEGDREAIKQGILKGMYKFKAAATKGTKLNAQLLGSGAILNKALEAQRILGEKYGVAADVWSVTSYKELHRDGLETGRWNLLHPGEEPRVPFITQCLANALGVVVAASDYVKALPHSVSQWIPQELMALGTDGFGRSDNRGALRDFFEVDARYITLATLTGLAREKKIQWKVVQKAVKDLGINPDKANPLTA
ncbi:MAG: pyruvate dehydrogenase (acetyl-transferring), homodimeric type [Abitibacteriaceae bacterium]|nr:pyruvate dehydrogenase (acetyl-transferring), homodimeric type [Abditibacteriaceae bacterium]